MTSRAKRTRQQSHKLSFRYLTIIGGIILVFVIVVAILPSATQPDPPSPSLSVNVASTSSSSPSSVPLSGGMAPVPETIPPVEQHDSRDNMTLLQLSLSAATRVPTLNWRLVTKLDAKQHPVGSVGELHAWRRFMHDLIQVDKPFIIKGAPLLFDNNHTKLSSWNDLSSIRRRLNNTNGNGGSGILDRVVTMQAGTNEFLYLTMSRVEDDAAQQRLRHWGFYTNSYIDDALNKQRWRQSMTADEFFTTNKSVYWSQDPSALGDVLINDMPPHSLLRDYFIARTSPLPSKRDIGEAASTSSTVAPTLEANIWMGHNIMNTCHYDAVHNLFIQLSGPKRFLLFPPSASHLMMPFSRLHPSYRHTMLNFSATLHDNHDILPIRHGITVAEFINETQPQVATLGAGDMLYIPPFWYHHVTTPLRAISMSLWTNAIQDDIAADAEIDVPLPIDDDWTHDRILATMGCFTLSIIRHLRPANQTLLRTTNAPSGTDAYNVITDIDVDDMIRQRFPYAHDTAPPVFVPYTPSGIERAHCRCAPDDDQRVNERARQVATIFNGLPLSTPNDVAIRKLQVYAYLERAWEAALSLHGQTHLITLPSSIAKLSACMDMWTHNMFAGIPTTTNTDTTGATVAPDATIV